MIKNLKKILVTSLFVGVGLYSETLEKINEQIANVKHPDLKQVLLCEREGFFIKKEPQECLKAAEMLIKSKKNITSESTYRFDFYGMSAQEAMLTKPDLYKQTDKEFIDHYIAESYHNAGVIYRDLGIHKESVKMLNKSLEYDPNF
jgi:tetratricopeptide (TPR) repeat protein